MAQAFRRSRIASAVVMILSAVIAVLIWIRDREHPIIVPIIASVLMLAIGWIAARVLGNLLASMENTRYLGYLHMELDPDKFLSCYRTVPGRMKPGSADAAICRSYLADGYAAKGEYAAALETLSEAPPEGNLPLKGLYALGRASNYLSLGDIAGADTALSELDVRCGPVHSAAAGDQQAAGHGRPAGRQDCGGGKAAVLPAEKRPENGLQALGGLPESPGGLRRSRQKLNAGAFRAVRAPKAGGPL